MFSEMELQMIRAWVKSGMANAKACWAKVERTKMPKEDILTLFYKHYPSYAAGKMNITELARVCDLSRNTVYKYISLLEE